MYRMKIFAGVVPLVLAGCGGGGGEGGDIHRSGMANPASVYCTKIGGKMQMRAEQGGQAGYCILRDGSVVEEWKLYRDHNPL
ncbi:DUF333 domain-containing protein [Paracoccaceae bacterium Fryx2]|nr:DUF333 domain-containing protein [Paracoccaceae bacterium Fryx2]